MWDAGTELNKPLDGAALVAGVDAMLGTVEAGAIHGQTLDGLLDAPATSSSVSLTSRRACQDR